MAKIFRYLLFVIGSVLGAIIGIWFIRQLLEEVRNEEIASQKTAEKVVARSTGDSSTDAPPPIEKPKPGEK